MDACFIGPNDLAASMHLPTSMESNNPRSVEATAHVHETARRLGVAPGIHTSGPAAANRRIEEGIQFVALASELRFVPGGTRGAVTSVTALAERLAQPAGESVRYQDRTITLSLEALEQHTIQVRLSQTSVLLPAGEGPRSPRRERSREGKRSLVQHGEGQGDGIARLRMATLRWPLDNQSGLLASMLRLALALALAACAAPSTPPDPLDEARAGSDTVRSYRYERVTLITQMDGATTIINETGEVILPDRQRLTVRGEASADEPGNEIIIVGDHAWTRPLGFWPIWTPTQTGHLPPDPLTIARGAIATAGAPADAGQRVMEDGRHCQGWAFPFDPRGVPRWPAAGNASETAAESTLWVEPGGRLCGQTVRVTRQDGATAEYTAVLRDFGARLTIEPPTR